MFIGFALSHTIEISRNSTRKEGLTFETLVSTCCGTGVSKVHVRLEENINVH